MILYSITSFTQPIFRAVLICFFSLIMVPIQAQTYDQTYETLRDSGLRAYDALKFEDAIKQFEAEEAKLMLDIEKESAIYSKKRAEGLLLTVMSEHMADTNYSHAIRLAEMAYEWTSPPLDKAKETLSNLYSKYGGIVLEHRYLGDSRSNFIFGANSNEIFASCGYTGKYQVIKFLLEADNSFLIFPKIHKSRIQDIKEYSNSSKLLTGGWDGQVIMWDKQTRQVIKHVQRPLIRRYRNWIDYIEVSPNEKLISYIDRSAYLRFIDMQSGQRISIKHGYTKLKKIKFLGNGLMLTFGHIKISKGVVRRGFKLWDIQASPCFLPI